MSELVTGDHALKRVSRSPEKKKAVFAGVPRPNWLLNDPEEDDWHLGDRNKCSSSSYYTIKWGYEKFPGSKGLVDRGMYWKDLAKQMGLYYLESDKTGGNTTNSLTLYGRELRTLCQWFCYERKCFDASSINSSDIKAFEEYVASLGVTVSAVITKLSALRLLWTLRKCVGDGLTLDPYMRRGAMKKKAKKIGIANGHTPTIKPEVLFPLINEALRVLSEARKCIDNLNIYLELKGIHGRNVAPQFKKKTGESSSVLYGKVLTVYGAAVFVILLLFGERKHELGETTTESVAALFDGDTEELLGTVRKTAKTLGGKETSRPVIKELVDALKVVGQLTRDVSRSYGGDLFFIRQPLNHCANKNPQVELSTNVIYRLLDRFALEAGYEGGNLRPHMFRRAFSMLWTWRFEIGDYHLLSKMLYHNDEVFTRDYTEDEDVFAFLPEEEQRLMYDIMEKSLSGEKTLFGGFGKTMKRYARLLQSKITLITPEAVHNFVKSMVSKHGYKLVSHVDGYCIISPARAKHARCSTDGKHPNYANRNDSYCVGCPNFGVDETRRSVWVKRGDAHKTVYESTDIPVLKKASEDGLDRTETVLRWLDKGK